MNNLLIYTVVCASLIGQILARTGLPCDLTNGKGPIKFAPCQFPFEFRNETYFACTDATEPNGVLWCSTEVDDEGIHISGKWGYCEEDCETKKNVPATTMLPVTSKDDDPDEDDDEEQIVDMKTDNKTLLSDVANNSTEDGSALPTEKAFTCGTAINVGYIVGGSDAAPGNYPFIAALGYKNKSDSAKFIYACGGALINRRYVLTAAHCQNTRDPWLQIAQVVLGEHNFAVDPDCSTCTPVQRFAITAADVIIHEDFSLASVSSKGNDVALIRLPQLARTVYDDEQTPVLPVCLAWRSTDVLPKGELVVAGWGRTNNELSSTGEIHTTGAFINILQHLVVPEVPFEECRKTPLFSKISAERHVCAGGARGQDSCRGDSGGPLIVRKNKFSAMYLKGIVSFGTAKCGQGLPGVYTNIEYYIPWIRSHLKP